MVITVAAQGDLYAFHPLLSHRCLTGKLFFHLIISPYRCPHAGVYNAAPLVLHLELVKVSLYPSCNIITNKG